MRPTTAINDNVFDFQALLHPGTVFEHPKDVVSHPDLTLAEAGDPCLLGLRRFGDRFMPRAAGAERTEGARQHRRHSRSALRTGRRPAQSAGRPVTTPLLHDASSGGLGDSHGRYSAASRDRPVGEPMGKPTTAGREGMGQQRERAPQSHHVQTDGAWAIPLVVKRARGADGRSGPA